MATKAKSSKNNILKKGKKAVEFIQEEGRVIIKRYTDYKKEVLFKYPLKAYWTMEGAQASAESFLNIA